MNQKRMIISLILVFLCYILVNVPYVCSTDFYVGDSEDCDFSFIKDALNNSVDGDSIFVKNGLFNESFIVDKSIDLVGDDKNSTIIYNNHSNYLIVIDSDYVNISNFTIKNGLIGVYISGYNKSNNVNISNNIFLNNSNSIYLGEGSRSNQFYNNFFSIGQEAIVLFNSSHNLFDNNYLETHDAYGISCWNQSNSNVFLNNTIDRCTYSFFLSEWSNNNTIIGNEILNNNAISISLSFSFNNLISENVLDGFNRGIYLENSGNNLIIDNYISNMDIFGIGTKDSDSNVIVNNSFFNCRDDMQDEVKSSLSISVYWLILLLVVSFVFVFVYTNYKEKNK